jgi:hypothetical protein
MLIIIIFYHFYLLPVVGNYFTRHTRLMTALKANKSNWKNKQFYKRNWGQHIVKISDEPVWPIRITKAKLQTLQ